MKEYKIRIAGGTNTNLLNEMVERNFYLPEHFCDAQQGNATIKTSISGAGFFISFSIPDKCDKSEFVEWAAKVPATMFDDHGYDWWNYYDEVRKISVDKCKNSIRMQTL